MNIHGYDIPDALAGAAVGAAIAALTNLFTNLYNDWRNTARLNIQNAHAEKLAANARDHAMKKEILLSLSDAIGKFQNELGGLPYAATLETSQRAFVEFSTSINKVTVVTSTNAAALATRLNAHFTTIYMNSLPKWATVNTLHDTFQTSLKNMNVSNERYAAVNSEYAEALKAARDQPNLPDIFAQYQQMVDVVRSESKQRSAELEDAQLSYQIALNHFTEEIIAIMNDSDRYTIPMLIAVRTELNVPTDEAELRRAFSEQKEAVVKSVRTAMDHVQGKSGA